jgi:hypothetical protein
LRVTKDAYISGTLYLNNVTVFGTQSVAYISSSQLNIGTNLITVNTDTPSIRFGGLAVYDSGSTGLTGSILWDSQNNHWVYSNPSGSSYSGGMFISGPRTSTLGSETGTTACMLMAGQGGDHITSSMIYHSSTVTCIPSALSTSGTATFNGCVNVNTGNQIRLYNSAKNNWVQIDSPLTAGDAAIDFKLTTQSGILYINNTGVACFNNAICAPRAELTSDASCVPLRLINGVITGGSTTGVTALYFGDAGSGVSMMQREKYAANQANLVLYSEYGYNTQSINACFGYNGVAFYTAGTKRQSIDSSGITCFSNTICAKSLWFSSNSTGQITFGANDACNAYVVSDNSNNLFIGNNNSYKILIPRDGSDMVLRTAATYANPEERMRIGSDGTKYFGVYNGSRIQISASGENLYQYTNTYYIWGLYNDANSLSIESAFGGCIIFRTCAKTTSSSPATTTERMRIMHNGNVGIATSSIPSDHILQIHSSCNYARMALTNTSTGVASGNGLIFQMENCFAIIKNQETSCLVLGTNGRETDIVINQNGNVGIGQIPINKFTILAGNSNVIDLFDTGAGFGIGMQAMNSAATVYRSWDFYASKYQFFSGQAIFSCTVCAPVLRASNRLISNYTQVFDGDFSLNVGVTRSVVLCGGIYTLGDFHLMTYGNAGTGMSSIRLSTYGYFANSNLLGFCEQLRYTFGSMAISGVSNNGTSISFNIANCSGSNNATGFWRMISLTGDSANSCINVYVI